MARSDEMKKIAENRRARFDYDILETIEAGIELLGSEVKSAKAGHMGLGGSYAVIRNGEAWLLNSQIPPYQPNNVPEGYDPARSRRLLLRSLEIKELSGLLRQKTLTLVGLSAFIKRGLVKIELGVAKSRKKSDKREVIKKRDTERDIRRSL
jgi:SsrA-binding protein